MLFRSTKVDEVTFLLVYCEHTSRLRTECGAAGIAHTLEPGETATVVFDIPVCDCTIADADANRIVEPGQVRPGFEGGQLPLYMRLPKLRGFKNPFKKEYQVVNVAVLAELFPQGGEITVADLVAKGAVRNGFPVKVLGDGEVSAAYTLKGVKASASAKSKIEAAGGSISED